MANETEIKKVKRIVFTDEFVDEGSPFVVEYENGSIEVFSMKWEATLTLRELAEEADIPFEYDWSLEKLTKAIKKEVGEDTIGITVGNICVYLASANGRAICGIKEEGTRAIVRPTIEYEKAEKGEIHIKPDNSLWWKTGPDPSDDILLANSNEYIVDRLKKSIEQMEKTGGTVHEVDYD